MGRARILVAASLFVLANACGGDPSSPSPEGKMVVTGTVSSRLPVDNARVVAIGTDGRKYWTYLDADRDFTLKLPVGQAYRVIIANQRIGGGQTTIGHLVVDSPTGASSGWLGANDAVQVDLGKIRPATTTPTSGIKPQCASCGGGGGGDSDSDDDRDDDKDSDSDHADDNDCYSDDDDDDKDSDSDSDSDSDDNDKSGGGNCSTCPIGGIEKSGGASSKDKDVEKCDVCTDGDKDVELEPTKQPGKVCEDKETKKPKSKKAYDDQKPCKKRSAGGADGGSSGGSTGGGGGGGGGADSGGGSAGGSSDGVTKPGGKCEQTTQCVNTCSCVASECSLN